MEKEKEEEKKKENSDGEEEDENNVDDAETEKIWADLDENKKWIKKFRTYYFNFLDMKLLNLVLLTIQAVSAADVDCYKLLGVTKKDTNKKIKSAYRFVLSYLDRVFWDGF